MVTDDSVNEARNMLMNEGFFFKNNISEKKIKILKNKIIKKIKFFCNYFYRMNKYEIVYASDIYRKNYLYNDKIKYIIPGSITYYYTVDFFNDVSASYVLSPKEEYTKKIIDLRVELAKYVHEYIRNYFKNYNIKYLIRALNKGYDNINIHFEKELNEDNWMFTYLYDRELDIRHIGEETESILKTIMMLIEHRKDNLKFMICILIENILYLNEKSEKFLSYRIDWSALGSIIKKLGKAIKRELDKKVYTEINWYETAELNIDDVLKSLIEQGNYRFILFGDLDFFVTVGSIRKRSYMKA